MTHGNEKSSDGTERCKNEDHTHDVIALGEEKDGTPFRERKCRECTTTWKVYKDWSLLPGNKQQENDKESE